MIIIHINPATRLINPCDEKNCSSSWPVAKPEPIQTDIYAPDNTITSLMSLNILITSFLQYIYKYVYVYLT